MSTKCPHCDRPLTPAAVADGWCPECGKRIPEFIRRAYGQPPTAPPPGNGPESQGWKIWAWLGLLAVGGGGLGVLFGMAKDGQLNAPAAAVVTLLSLALLAGRAVELAKQRQSRR